MITLFQFPRVWGLPNASPFCMKVENYLRMAKIPYDIHFVNNPQRGPKRKLPFIKVDGVLYADSEIILDELKKSFGNRLEQEFTIEQKAYCHVIDLAFSERLYWVEVYMRWQMDEGWNVLKQTMFNHLPQVSRLFVPNMVRKNMLKQLDYQGFGRHSLDEVLFMGKKTVDALAAILGENPYFLGSKPSTIDATSFAFLANIIFSPLNSDFKQYVSSLDNIKTYCHRMWEQYYPDFPKPEI